MPENKNGKKPAILTVGTPQCAAACAVLGALIAVLLLTIGFWKTLFIALCILAGLFVGGVSNKDEYIRSVTEAVLPRKEVKVYQAQEKKPVPQAQEPDEDTEDEDEEEEETEEEEPDDADGEEEDAEEEEEEDGGEAEDTEGAEEAEEAEEEAEDGDGGRKAEA